MIFNIAMNHRKGEKFSRSKTAKSALIVLRSMGHELPFFNKFINLLLDQRRLVCSWYCTSNHQYLLIFIDGLQLRHSFSAPKQLDVKMPLQSIDPYRKSMFNSFSGRI